MLSQVDLFIICDNSGSSFDCSSTISIIRGMLIVKSEGTQLCYFVTLLLMTLAAASMNIMTYLATSFDTQRSWPN